MARMRQRLQTGTPSCLTCRPGATGVPPRDAVRLGLEPLVLVYEREACPLMS